MYLSTELKPTERLPSYRNSVLNVSECIKPVRLEEEEEVTCAGYKHNNCFSYSDEELELFFIANGNDEAPSQSFHNSKFNYNFKEHLSLCKKESFWVLLFNYSIQFS